MKNKILWLIVCLLPCYCLNAIDNDKIVDTIKLHEVVVNARLNQPFSYFPAKKSQLSSDDVVFYTPQTAADLLGIGGSVFIQKSQMAGGSPMIRGFATNRLLYSVDGVRMNTAIFRAGNLHNVISLDPFATENAEILFGPNSVLYGSDALGGVMNFSTLQPVLSTDGKFFAKGNALARYSSANDEKTFHIDMKLGWKKWALVTSVSNFDYGNLKIGSRGPKEYTKDFIVQRSYKTNEDIMVANPNPNILDPTGYNQTNIMQKVLFHPNNNWMLEYAFHVSQTSDLPRYDRLFIVDNKKPDQAVYSDFRYGPQKWMMNLLTVKNNNSNIMYDDMTMRLAIQDFEESRLSRKFKKNDLKTQVEEVTAYSANLDLFKQPMNGLKLFYGFEYVRNDVNSNATKTDITTSDKKDSDPRYADSQWQSASAYLTSDYALLPSLHILSGIRYNWNDIKMDFNKKLDNIQFDPIQRVTNSAISGSLGINYTFCNDWNTRANYSRGFRSPNVDDFSKTFEHANGYIVLPNANIKPEYANNYEIGLGKIKGKYFTFDLSAYFTTLDNVILMDYFTLNGKDKFGEDRIKARQNGKSAYLYGASLFAKAHILDCLYLTTNLNYQMGKETTMYGVQSTMPHVAPLFGDIRLAYDKNKFKIELYSIFNAAMTPSQMPIKVDENEDNYLKDSNGKLYSPSWATVNIKGLYRLNDNINIVMGVENIGDMRYRIYRSGVPSMGRNFVFSVAFKF